MHLNTLSKFGFEGFKEVVERMVPESRHWSDSMDTFMTDQIEELASGQSFAESCSPSSQANAQQPKSRLDTPIQLVDNWSGQSQRSSWNPRDCRKLPHP